MSEPDQFVTTIRSHDDLIEAFWTVKERIGISNLTCDQKIGVADGYTDRVIGPARSKTLSPFMFDALLSMFALEIEVRVNLEAAARVAWRWEPRDATQLRWNGRVSQRVLDRAKPHVLRDFSKAGGTASGALRSGSQGSEIMRKRALARWRKQRKAERIKRVKLRQGYAP